MCLNIYILSVVFNLIYSNKNKIQWNDLRNNCCCFIYPPNLIKVKSGLLEFGEQYLCCFAVVSLW